MRFKLNTAPEYEEGDVRTIKKFLLLPKCINDEVRWLEWAYIEQVRKEGPDYWFYWLDIAFVGDMGEQK